MYAVDRVYSIDAYQPLITVHHFLVSSTLDGVMISPFDSGRRRSHAIPSMQY